MMMTVLFLSLFTVTGVMATGCAHQEDMNQFNVEEGRAYFHRQEKSLKYISGRAARNKDLRFMPKNEVYRVLGPPALMARNQWIYYPMTEDEGTQFGNQKIKIVFSGIGVKNTEISAMDDRDWGRMKQARDEGR